MAGERPVPRRRASLLQPATAFGGPRSRPGQRTGALRLERRRHGTPAPRTPPRTRDSADSPCRERRLTVPRSTTRRAGNGDSPHGSVGGRGACCSRPGPLGTGPRPSLRRPPGARARPGLAARGRLPAGRDRGWSGTSSPPQPPRPRGRLSRPAAPAAPGRRHAHPLPVDPLHGPTEGRGHCSRFAIRRMSVERLVPAAWNTAGLKKAASPFRSGSCTWCSSKYARISGRRRPDSPARTSASAAGTSSGRSRPACRECATAPCKVKAGDRRWTCAGVPRAGSSVMNPRW